MQHSRDHEADREAATGVSLPEFLRQYDRLARQALAAVGFLSAALVVSALFTASIFATLSIGFVLFVMVTLGTARFRRALVNNVRELEVAREEAVATAGNKARFLANMSHEVRTPMNGILGMAELLVRTDLDEDQQQMASTIQVSADALLSVLNDILDYSKIEAGKLELESADFDIWQTIDDCAGLLHTNAEQKGVELMTFVDPRICRSHRGDQARLRQIVLNLLSNAIKFTIEGEVAVSVDLVEEDGSSQTLRIAVRDSGIGIGEEAIGKLFTSFAQADASTTRRFGGTGLGLAISGRLAELMGAEIEVESVEGQGSTFSVIIQLPFGDPSRARPRASDLDLAEHSVLIVEDNKTHRDLLVQQLVPTRMRIDTASNAIAAIDVLREAGRSGRPFTMAILDMTMPGIDGLELAQAIHNDPGVPRLPIALTSSLGARPGLVEMAAADVFRWLNKPLSSGRLLQVVHDMASVRGTSATEASFKPVTELPAVGVAPALSLRLLVAEDNEINRRVLAGMLSRVGCEVVFAVDGREAVQMVLQSDFDLVLMDCQMPEMDGFEATRTIRQAGGGYADLPIIALTANVMPADRDACLAAGMSDFLAKPVKLDVLRAAIQRWGQPMPVP